MMLAAMLCFASVMSVMAVSETPDIQKEEVIYVSLNMDGSVREINVVNIFDLDQDGRVIDYGKYQSLRNMTTTDKIDYSEDTVTIDAKAGKLYYEGKLDNNVMPWKISIRYFMDGKEYSGEKIAGMSGALRIKVSVTQNEKCSGNFFDGFALQAALTLDTKQCKNIVAESATIANVGSDKQLSFTILPGKGADIEIKADVTDFEMGSISVNGIPLNLNIEVNDKELLAQVTELLDAIEKLDDGASQLKDGASKLQSGAQDSLQKGTKELQDGAEQLQSGAVILDESIQSLNMGIGQIQSALDDLNKKSPVLRQGSSEFKSALAQLQTALNSISATWGDVSELTNASSGIKKGIDSLVSGATLLQQSISYDAYKAAMSQKGLNVDELKQNNDTAIQGLQKTIAGLNEQINAAKAAGAAEADIAALTAQVAQLQSIITLLGANNANIQGVEAYLTTLNQNAGTLVQGAVTLQAGYAAFDAKIAELAETLGGLPYQMALLASAVNTLVSEYEKLDAGIQSYTDGVAQIVARYAQVSRGAVKVAAGSAVLKTGADSLYQGTGALNAGALEILAGIAQVHGGTSDLKDGTAAMRERTAGMDTKITNQIDDLLSSLTGGNMEISSFVSERNTNVKSVQFVIKSDAVQKITAVETVAKEAEHLNFWQKLLRLFGLY